MLIILFTVIHLIMQTENPRPYYFYFLDYMQKGSLSIKKCGASMKKAPSSSQPLSCDYQPTMPEISLAAGSGKGENRKSAWASEHTARQLVCENLNICV